MCAWSVIRKATEDDKYRLEKSARRFVMRHEGFHFGLKMAMAMKPPDDRPWTFCVEHCLEESETDSHEEYIRLNMLWRRCVRRALRHPDAEGIEYGYVGFSA
jgi:hypothetical protein